MMEIQKQGTLLLNKRVNILNGDEDEFLLTARTESLEFST